MTDRARLNQIRERIKQAPSEWRADFDGKQYTIMAIPLMTTGNDATARHEEYAKVHGDALEVSQLIINAPDDIGFLLGLIDRSISKVNQLKATIEKLENREKPKNYASNAAILIKEYKFKEFLKMRHGLSTMNDDAADRKVKEMLGIASKKQLNSDPNKAEIWLRLTREFEGWKRHG